MSPHTPTHPLIAAVSRREVERVGLLLAEGIDPNARNFDGDRETALMVAAGSGFDGLVGQLLAAGADASMQDMWGRTACIWAAEVPFDGIASRLWQHQYGKPISKLKRQDLFPTRLDAIATPLTSSCDYLVLYARAYTVEQESRVRFLALGATGDRDGALEIISRDNNRMVTTGPYLLCKRIILAGEMLKRPANPVVTSLKSFNLQASQLLLLVHQPTASVHPGGSLSSEYELQYRGWAAINGVFAKENFKEARVAAESEPGRVSLVQLIDVCTCFEGWVESHGGLEKTEETLRTLGDSRRVQPGVPEQPVTDNTSTKGQRSDYHSTATERGKQSVALQQDFCIKRGFELFRQCWGGFVAFSSLLSVLALVTGALLNKAPLWFPIVITCILIAPLFAGFFPVSLKLAAGRCPGFSDFFLGYRHILPGGLYSLMLIGLVILTRFIPLAGFVTAYVGFGSMYVVPLIVDCNLDLISALSESWRMTHDRFSDNLFQVLVILLVMVSGLVLLGVGIWASMPWACCILTAAYRRQKSA